MSTSPIVLVTGATGVQGGGVAKELLAQKKFTVRAFVRNTDTPAAKELQSLGAEIAVGHFDDVESIEKAVKGVYGVFAVQKHDGNAAEQALNLVNASKKAGVNVFIQTTVASTGHHFSFPGWGKGVLNEGYWNIKHESEEHVKRAGFSNFTILQPGAFYENLLPPRQGFFYPDFKNGIIKSNVPTSFNVQMLSGKDVGVWCANIFNDPSKFNGKSIGLGEDKTFAEVAQELSKSLGKEIKYEDRPAEELLAAGYYPDYITACTLMVNIGGYYVDKDYIEASNIPYAGFEWFINEYKNQF